MRPRCDASTTYDKNNSTKFGVLTRVGRERVSMGQSPPLYQRGDAPASQNGVLTFWDAGASPLWDKGGDCPLEMLGPPTIRPNGLT